MEVSTAWLDLFEAHRDLDLEPTDYFSLDKLDAVPPLRFLKRLCWDEVRDWIRHDTTPMSEVTDLPDVPVAPGRLFIGGMNDALSDEALARHGVAAVVSIHPKDLLAWDSEDASYGLRRFGEGSQSPVKRHLMVPLSDDSKEDLSDWFGRTEAFLGERLGAGDGVLVHCKSGRSRSVAVVVAFAQRRYWEDVVQPREVGSDEALEMMRVHRERVVETVQKARMPIKLIMERFTPLLDLYDMQLVGHPGYEEARRRLYPDAAQGTEDKKKAAKGGPESVKAVGAVLKLAVAIVFYKHGQKPLRSVVQRFFSVRDEYYPELEGLRDEEGGTYDFSGAGHAKPGIVGFYARFADEYGIAVPEAASAALSRAARRS